MLDSEPVDCKWLLVSYHSKTGKRIKESNRKECVLFCFSSFDFMISEQSVKLFICRVGNKAVTYKFRSTGKLIKKNISNLFMQDDNESSVWLETTATKTQFKVSSMGIIFKKKKMLIVH